MRLHETQRRERERSARAEASKANGSRGQSAAPANLSLGPITASATASAPRVAAIAKPTPAPSAPLSGPSCPAIAEPTPAPSAPSSGPSCPAISHSSRATSLPSMPADSDHAITPSDALLPASSPRHHSQPADSTDESFWPFQLLQPLQQSRNLIRFRMDAPKSQDSGSNKRQKLE